MKLKKNLILVGMMASGKSTIGRLLAKRLNLRFYDADFIIEKKLKMKISEIFLKKGEPTFRKLEKKITLNIMTKKNYVLSLGGGAFLNNKIRQFAQKTGETFYLNWDSKTLINRIKKNNKRPLASNLSNNELKELIISRSKIYLEAKHIINCENLKKTEIVNKIIKNFKI